MSYEAIAKELRRRREKEEEARINETMLLIQAKSLDVTPTELVLWCALHLDISRAQTYNYLKRLKTGSLRGSVLTVKFNNPINQ